MRLIGLVAIGWIQALAIVRLFLGGTGALAREAAILDWSPVLSGLPPAPIAAALAALGVLLGTLFWVTTGQRALEQGWAVPGLLLQFALGVVASTDVLVLVAFQTPFVLPFAAAHRAAAAQVGALAVASLGALLLGVLAPVEQVAGAPHWLQALLAAITLLVWQAVAYGVGYIAVSEGRERGELAVLNAELEATQQLLSASTRLAERSRVARTLHQRLSRRLSALAVALEAAARGAEAPVGDILREAHTAARALVREATQILSEIKDSRALDLRTALETLVRQLVRPQIHLRFEGDLTANSPARAHALFRCAQEALTNALRHADAANVRVSLERDGDVLRLEVCDDGRGAARLEEGNGLRGMRDRLEEVGGSLGIRTGSGAGFTLSAAVPDPAE